MDITILPSINKPTDRKRIKKQYHLKTLDPCPLCKKYKKCQKLCLQAERYINQDEDPDHWQKIHCKAKIENREQKTILNQSTTEIIITNYFVHRMQIKDIAELHYKSKQYIYKLIKKYENILIENIKKSTKNG